MDDAKNWEWASRPITGKVGRFEVYKRYFDSAEMNKKRCDAMAASLAIVHQPQKPQENVVLKKKEKNKHVDSGVYCIVCEAEKYVYIGQSCNIPSRLRAHKLALMGAPKSKTYIKMKEHVKKHGISSFDFIVYKRSEVGDLRVLLDMESDAMTDYARRGYSLYNTSINFNVLAGTVSCPIEFHEIIKTVISKLQSGDLQKISKILEL